MTDTLILGGGLAGCAAALWLADHGHSATIVEARRREGLTVDVHITCEPRKAPLDTSPALELI